MALMRRGRRSDRSDDVLGQLLLEGTDMIEQTGWAHRQRWGLGTTDRWSIDQETATIGWVKGDVSMSAPVQVIGSHNPTAGSWVWAWANNSLLPGVRSASEEIRAWAQDSGQDAFLQGKRPADAEQAANLATIAFRVLGATGFYRAPAGSSTLFVVFGDVTVEQADGASEVFRITVE